MKLSAQLVFWLSLVFACLCIAYAGFGFSSIDANADPQLVADGRGYAWFWLFLGSIGVVLAVVSWRLRRKLRARPASDGGRRCRARQVLRPRRCPPM